MRLRLAGVLIVVLMLWPGRASAVGEGLIYSADQYGSGAIAIPESGGAFLPSCGGMRARAHAGHSAAASGEQVVVRDATCAPVIVHVDPAVEHRNGGVEFSYDDTKLAVIEKRGGRYGLQIYAIDWTDRTLTATAFWPALGSYGAGGSWRPDGSAFVFSMPVGKEGKDDILSIDVATGVVTNLTNTASLHETSPEYAPDGWSLAFTRQTRNRVDIWVRSGGADRQVTSKSNANVVHALAPSWSPDGRNIAFAGLRQNLSGYDVWRIASNASGKAKNLTVGASGSYPAAQWR